MPSRQKKNFHHESLASIFALANFLVGEARLMERSAGRGAGAEAAKKEAREQVPGEKVRDASALARGAAMAGKLSSQRRKWGTREAVGGLIATGGISKGEGCEEGG